MGARQARAPRLRPEAPSLNSGRPPGGQHTIGLFGILGHDRTRYTDAQREAAKVAGTEVAPEVKAPLPRQQPPASRRVAVPTVAVGLAMPRCWQPATPADSNSLKFERIKTTPAPIRLRLSRERLGVFMALAQIEQRSLEDVLADNVADTAGRLLRTRHELHLDPYDAQVLAEYIDGLAARQEAWEAQEAESAARAATTPAMRQAAAAADERERHPEPDLEEFDRSMSWGHVELAIALD